MSQNMKNVETSYTNGNLVFEDDKGYFLQRQVTVQVWNDYLRKYEKHPELARVEKVYTDELDPPLVKRAEQKIYIEKHIQSNESLSDEVVVFECTLVWEYSKEERYKPFFWRINERSGEVMQVQLDSGACSPAGVNSEFVKRTNVKKCVLDTQIPRKATVFVLNPTDNSLERKLPDAM